MKRSDAVAGKVVLCALAAAIVSWPLRGRADPAPRAKPLRRGEAPPGAGADWPQWRGPNRDGISAETDWVAKWPQTGPKVLWRAKVGEGFAGFAVVKERLYTMGFIRQSGVKSPGPGKEPGSDHVWCLDARTGTVLWKHAYHCVKGSYYGPFATPTVDGDRLYTLSKLGRLLCLDSASGKVVWSRNVVKDLRGKKPYYGYASCPLVVGELLVVGTGGEAALAALNKKTGKLVWQSGKGGQTGYSCPVAYDAGGTTAIAILTPPGAFAADAKTGKELWRHPWGKGPNSSVTTPIVVGNNVFVSASEQKKWCALLKVGRAAPEVVWENDQMLNYFNASVLWRGHLFGVHSTDHHSRNSSLRCVDFNTGKVKWDTGGVGKGAVTLAGGRLIILTEKGELVIAEANPARYVELARAKVLDGTCWTPPVLCGGRIYCRNHRGTLVCLDVRRK